MKAPRSYRASQFAMIDHEDGTVAMNYVIEGGRRVTITVEANMADLLEAECLKRKKLRSKMAEPIS